ncbi:hypothetical protein TNCT_597551 [Trichonephila clavata]|uniref:Uncharacterized protein n=1 Tax=Trichonephila clavata TaxID=2740835 RepID=A0A8X6KWP5_TRICU|nr:hypothetical protein TNCT_597551 [Trichonephila clavata]
MQSALLLKEKRRAQQQKNVEKKAAAAAAANKGNEIEGGDSDEHEEDIKWYRQEVGEDPDENIFHAVKKSRATINGQRPRKRVKLSESSEKWDTSADINKKKVKFSDHAKMHKNHGKLQDSKKGKFSGRSLPFSKKKNVKKIKKKA